MEKGAIISDCKKFRYRLWRVWDKTKPKVLFIMLNPSTADENNDDPTIRRCINFAKSWGYGGVFIGNLFAYRTAYPKELKEAGFLIGDDNESHLKEMKGLCDKVVCAWGNQFEAPSRITSIFDNLYCIELSKTGIPKHPLYLKKELKPIPLIP
tara:strand:- start:121 stop:579 length:459 start_codon:yes stop_codon:yes gene_type:complete